MTLTSYAIKEWLQDTYEEEDTLHKTNHGMRLRPRPQPPSSTRKPLAAISANAERPRKRKRPNPLPPTGDPVAKCPKRMPRTPSPQKSLPQRAPANSARQRPEAEQQEVNMHSPHQVLRPTRTATSLGRRRSQSPSKARRGTTLNGTVKISSLKMADLQFCDVPVEVKLIQEVREEGLDVSDAVLNLHKRLDEIAPGVIPKELKALYEADDTPRKTKVLPKARNFSQDAGLYGAEGWRLQSLKYCIDTVEKDTRWNQKNNASERQWGNVISDLLREPRKLSYSEDFRLINMEDCRLGPDEILPVMPGGIRLEPNEETLSTAPSEDSKTGSATQSTNRNYYISKIIDWSYALELPPNDLQPVIEAFKTFPHHARTLNQTNSFPSTDPIFLNVELKKQYDVPDPRVQLAIWAIAGLKKRRIMAWETTFPVPGITIEGDVWKCYIFFEAKSGMIMLGPYPMGATSSKDGVWSILYLLDQLVQWGTNDFKKWYDDTMILWAEQCIADDYA